MIHFNLHVPKDGYGHARVSHNKQHMTIWTIYYDIWKCQALPISDIMVSSELLCSLVLHSVTQRMREGCIELVLAQ